MSRDAARSMAVVHSAVIAIPAPRSFAGLRALVAAAAWRRALDASLSRFVARAVVHVLLAVLVVGAVTASRAWDADTMLRAAAARSPQALASARALQGVLASLVGQDDAAKLNAINDFFNRRIVFASDQEIWGQADYWASPLEMFEKGRGDCEDYVIGKYFSLIAAGMPSAKLRLVYVRAQIGGSDGVAQAHMVLAYYATPGAEPLVLDSLIGEIRPASRRPDLAPVFSFNSDGLWQGTGGPSAGDPVARLSRWREVLAKARSEGFQ
jgi:predicted transglutaminase-like cysteine proteinase